MTEDDETLVEFRVSNEFAFVDVALQKFGNGERLMVRSHSRNTSILLDPVVLEVLSSLTPPDLEALVARDLDR
ncbi:hypothetical protein CH251_05335 [Rhodococcus sp. 06-462-5]|uniref:hypothetical protein n=1 Tax=unclassified Rhodococcus (in: high G+C Gram-positive bacteria) TaxID=192944 RepID=UPI000B9B0B88|nr:MULTISPECIES: hypothetical protein [unclassified Rhodococcus (in: high G+C Gram-positive bacteria)]OZC77216.1 hypothetical protein CH251_05335 [Rhodococcus sp. 06-462-5]OZE63373.1 hypothetical protein CH270_17915 [Rhodococcus sp. 02-925g]